MSRSGPFSFDERARWLARYVLPHEPALRSWLARRVPQGLELDDLVQETYAKLSAIEDVDCIENVRAYMFRTAFSLIASHLRRAQIVSINSYANLEEFDFLDDAADPEEQLLARDELERIGQAIAAMPPRMQQVFRMRRIEGLSQRQVAERMGVTESTIEKQMGSAILRLSELFSRGGKRQAAASKPGTGVERNDHATRNQQSD